MVQFFASITAMIGVQYMTLIIIALTLVLFAMDKLPVGLVAMISAIVLGVFGCMDKSKVYSGWASSLTLMVMGMIVVGDAMFQTGAVTMIGRAIMKSKFAHNERAVMVIIMLFSGLLSAFLSNTAVVATFIPLIGAMVATSNGKLKNKNLMMPLGFAASIGGTLTLVGSTSQPMVNTVLEEQGLPLLKMFDFVPVALPSFILLIIYMVTIGYKLENKVLDFDDVVGDVDASQIENFKPTWRTWVSIGVMIFCVLGFVRGWWNTAVIALIGAAVVLLTGCVTFKGAFQRMDWNTIFIMAFAQGIAAAMNDSGAGKMIAEVAVKLVGNNLWMQMAACVIVITILTNIMSNTATAAMMAPIYILIAAQLGVAPYSFMMAIAVATNLTAATPIGGTAVSMTLQAGYRFSDFLKIGTPINIVWAIITIILCPLVFGFVPV